MGEPATRSILMQRAKLSDHFTCPHCHLGHLDLHLTVYVRVFGSTLIHVPNTPAWECDVCHHRQFEEMSIQRIEMLVGEAGPPPNRYRPPGYQPHRLNRVTEHAGTTIPKMGTKPKPTKAQKPRAKAKA